MANNRSGARAANAELVNSAGVLEASAEEQAYSADRRTELAADRTVLAVERTYAAWVRTGLSSLAAGIGARALLASVVPIWLTIATGTVLILFSAFCFTAAVWREWALSASTLQANTRMVPWWLLAGVDGFLVLVSLAALAGVWSV